MTAVQADSGTSASSPDTAGQDEARRAELKALAEQAGRDLETPRHWRSSSGPRTPSASVSA